MFRVILNKIEFTDSFFTASFPLISVPGVWPFWFVVIVKKRNWRQFFCVCPLIDDELRQNIKLSKFIAEPLAHFDKVMTLFIISKMTDA